MLLYNFKVYFIIIIIIIIIIGKYWYLKLHWDFMQEHGQNENKVIQKYPTNNIYITNLQHYTLLAGWILHKSLFI